MSANFRNDIQGLRAIAVGSVVIFHSFPKILPGGFVGVDMFFVISGFLISSIIFREIKGGTFSIADFYRKRIRRIFPALIITLAVTLVAGWLILSPQAYEELARNTATSALFVSNVDFFKSSGYFDRAAEFRPLLHTWSLSVEEQFYIFFPLALLCVMKLFPRAVLASLIIAFFISLCLSQWALGKSPMGAYFLFPFRSFELLLGAICALMPTTSLTKAPRIRFALTAIGLALILSSILFLSPEYPFPGALALLPTVGTGLVLIGGKNGDSPAARAISSTPFIFIGAISYSLYLWHWPVLAYLRITSQPDHATTLATILAVATSIIIATLTYRYVELPFSRISINRNPVIRYGTASLIFAGSISVIIWSQAGFPNRFSREELNLFSASLDYSPERGRCHQEDQDRISYKETCILGAKNTAPSVVIWGDSHGAELALALADSIRNSGLSLRQVTASACPPVVEHDFKNRPSCRSSNDEVLRGIIIDKQVETVVLTMNHDAYLNEPDYKIRSGYKSTVRELTNHGKRVIMVEQIPNIGMDAASVAGYAVSKGNDPSMIGMDTNTAKEKAMSWNDFLHSIAVDTGAEAFDPLGALCGEYICPIYKRDSGVLYFNETHISMSGAKLVANSIFDDVVTLR